MLSLPTASPYQVRLATRADVPALARIRNASWRAAYGGIVPAAELDAMTIARSSRLIAGTIARRGRVVMVIERRGRPLGYTLAGPQPRAHVPFRGEVYELYIDPAVQRRGAGTQLLTATLWRLSALGLTPAMLWVLEQNDARHFYAGCGGRPIARAPVTVGGRSLRRVAYAWDEFLPLPATT